MIGVPKEVVLNDFNEVLSQAFQETGDFNVENYCFFICHTLFHTLKIWLLDGNINAGLTKIKGVEISLIENTQYFYLKYSGYPYNPNYPKFPEIEPIINIVGVNLGYRIKRIEKIFAPTETIKKYIQSDRLPENVVENQVFIDEYEKICGNAVNSEPENYPKVIKAFLVLNPSSTAEQICKGIRGNQERCISELKNANFKWRS